MRQLAFEVSKHRTLQKAVRLRVVKHRETPAEEPEVELERPWKLELEQVQGAVKYFVSAQQFFVVVFPMSLSHGGRSHGKFS